jgi:hypothetical protein
VGTVLPDALGRAVPLGLEQLWLAGVPVPMAMLWPWSALHEPVGWALAATVAGCAFVREHRVRATLALMAGAALHTALDVLQDHHGEGYLLLAPFTDRDFELGWIGSEATVGIALPLAAVTAAAWLPAGVEALFGVPRWPPRVLALVAIPIAIGFAVDPVVGAWVTAGCTAAVAATHRWWRGRSGEFVGVAAALATLALVVGLRS